MTPGKRSACWWLGAVVAIGTLGAVVWTSRDDAGEPGVLAQVYSTKCQTSGGVCYVAAQPVGSPCTCGGQVGTIIP